jgi:hypothetical protein
METPHSSTIMTRDEVAQWLKLKPRQVERLGIPCINLGRKTKRYFAIDVLEWLQTKRFERGRPQGIARARDPALQFGRALGSEAPAATGHARPRV